MPVMTGIQKTTNGVQITWDGPSGYYQVWHKLRLTDATWLTVGKPTNLSRTATSTNNYSNDFFRVSGPCPSICRFPDLRGVPWEHSRHGSEHRARPGFSGAPADSSGHQSELSALPYGGLRPADRIHGRPPHPATRGGAMRELPRAGRLPCGQSGRSDGDTAH